MHKLFLSAALAAVPVSGYGLDLGDYSGGPGLEKSNVPTLEHSGVPRLETVVIVASRMETPLREVAAAVSIMDQEDIQARGHQSLTEVLRVMPAVTVTNSGGLGKATSLRVRGEDGYRTLVRVDGVDISDPTGTQASTQVQHLMSAHVERVELLRGPQGMMYGADAGGVVNITTRRAEPGWQGGAALEGGRYNSESYSAHAGVAGDLGDGYWSIGRVRTGGYNAHVDDPTQDHDGYKNTTWHGRQGLNLTSALRLVGVLRDTEAVSEFDRCGSPRVDDCIGHFRQRNQRLSLTHERSAGQNSLAFSKTRVNRMNLAGGEVSYDTSGTIAKWEFNGHWALNRDMQLAYGLEHREDQVRESQREQRGGYLEYQLNVQERWYFTAGMRGDHNQDFGTHSSYRISGAHLMPTTGAGTLKFKSSLSTGFRAPSLWELDYNRASDHPNMPQLAQEDSRGMELGVEYFGARELHLEWVLFEQRIDNEIYFDLVDFSGYLQGEQSSRSRGVEIIGAVLLGETLRLNANYTLVSTRADSGAPRSRQPRHLANVGIQLRPLERLSVAAQVRAAHHIEDTASGTRLDDYRVLDASLRYQLVPQAHVYVRGENLLNADYQEVPGYNTSGAAGYAGVEINF